MRSRSTSAAARLRSSASFKASSRVRAIARHSPIKSPIASPPMAASATYSATPLRHRERVRTAQAK